MPSLPAVQMGEPTSGWCHAVWAWWDSEIAERLRAGLQAEGDTAQWEHPAAGHRGGHGVTLFNMVPKLSNWNMSGHLCNLSSLKIRNCVFIVPLLQLEICQTGMFGCKICYFAFCKRETKERSIQDPSKFNASCTACIMFSSCKEGHTNILWHEIPKNNLLDHLWSIVLFF